MNIKYPNRSPILLAILFGLSACGGGGGGSGNGSNSAPVAKAGADQTVDEGVSVRLDASASRDADGDSLSYTWSQTDGPAVSLSGATTRQPSFTAPSIPGGSVVTFKLVVSDGSASSNDSTTIKVLDVTSPTAEASTTSGFLGKQESIVVTFSEPMSTASLDLSGNLASEAVASWSSDGMELTLTPDSGLVGWTSDVNRTLNIQASDASGNNSNTIDGDWTVGPYFEDFQAAERVIGQSDFLGLTANAGGLDADTVNLPVGNVAVSNGFLYVSDTLNNRILGFNSIPGINGANADFQLGQADMTSNLSLAASQTSVKPIGLSTGGGRMFIADASNNRVLVHNTTPTNGSGVPQFALGQADLISSTAGCGDDVMNFPKSVIVAGDKLLVTDSGNHRLLIWLSIPTVDGQPADMVLGQEDMDHCLKNGDGSGVSNDSSFATPNGVWSDGEKIAVSDKNNDRVMIWSQFPELSNTPPDIILESSGAAPAIDISDPGVGIASNGHQFLISDSFNNRVLIWDTFPTESNQAPDHVLGQGDFSHVIENDSNQDDIIDVDASDISLNGPQGLTLFGNLLFVSDNSNNRVLMYRSK